MMVKIFRSCNIYSENFKTEKGRDLFLGCTTSETQNLGLDLQNFPS